MIRRLPILLFVVTVTLVGATAWLQRSDGALIAISVIGGCLTLIALVAAVVATKLPRNAVGWLMAGGALTVAFHLFVTGYASYAIETDPGSLPFGMVAAWMSLWVGSPALALFITVLLLFPNGRLLSPRWEPLLWLLAASALLVTLGFAAKPGPIDNIPSVHNPVSFWGGLVLYRLSDTVFQTIVTLVALAAIVSLFVRMRRATGAERQQLKWFVYAVAMFPVLFSMAMALDAILDVQLGRGDHFVDFLLIMLGAALVPIAMGVSILRYRLYDIDVVINKTLVYVSLTAVLAACYLALIVLLQRVLPLARDSDVAVAASTLAVAALFQPLRLRVQALIDRRFYRHKYDAAETLGRFSGRLRDQVELDTLSRELVGAVARTMQPSHVSLWLREGTSR